MSDEDNSPKQKIDAGDRSHNVQVGRDYHHHDGARKSLLLRPDQSEVEKFDPRFRHIREEADREMQRAALQDSAEDHVSSLMTAPKLLLLALLLVFLIVAIF